MTIVGVAGAIGSGKTFVASDIAAATGGTRVGFGDYLRSVAAEQDVESDRRSLQAMGEQLLQQLGAAELSARVVGHRSGTVVVDGVRHVSVDDALRKLADHYLLVYVDVDRDVRRRRLIERANKVTEPARIDAHSTERELPQLRDRADLVIDSSGSAAVLALVRG